jgi:hypothetical protein
MFLSLPPRFDGIVVEAGKQGRKFFRPCLEAIYIISVEKLAARAIVDGDI